MRLTPVVLALFVVCQKPLAAGDVSHEQIKKLKSQMTGTRFADSQKEAARKALEKISRKLAAQLDDRNESVRFRAASLLTEIGRPAAVSVYWVKLAVFDDSDRVRAQIAKALGEMREKGKLSVRNLMYLVEEDKVWWVRGNAATALGRIGDDAELAVPTLVKALLKDSSPDVRGRAAASLGAIGKRPKIAVPALVKALNDTAKDAARHPRPVCYTAVTALQSFGTEAKSAVPALLKELSTLDQRMRGLTIFTLGHVGVESDEAIAALRKIMSNPNEQLFWGTAANAFGVMGQRGKSAVPELTAALRFGLPYTRRADSVRCDILHALGTMGSHAKSSVAAIIELCRDQKIDSSVHETAFRTFGKIGPAAKEAIPTLIDRLNKRQYDDASIIIGLKGIGKDAIPALMNNLSQERSILRNRTIIALGEFGPDARAALPLLRMQLKHITSRYVAERAIKRIQGKSNQ